MIESPSNHETEAVSGQRNPPLHTEKIFCDRKIFFLDLKENDRGRFLKITEDVRGRRDTIMLPIEALDEFITSLCHIADFEDELDEASGAVS